jgi:hypothetical protein
VPISIFYTLLTPLNIHLTNTTAIIPDRVPPRAKAGRERQNLALDRIFSALRNPSDRVPLRSKSGGEADRHTRSNMFLIASAILRTACHCVPPRATFGGPLIRSSAPSTIRYHHGTVLQNCNSIALRTPIAARRTRGRIQIRVRLVRQGRRVFPRHAADHSALGTSLALPAPARPGRPQRYYSAKNECCERRSERAEPAPATTAQATATAFGLHGEVHAGPRERLVASVAVGRSRLSSSSVTQLVRPDLPSSRGRRSGAPGPAAAAAASGPRRETPSSRSRLRPASSESPASPSDG